MIDLLTCTTAHPFFCKVKAACRKAAACDSCMTPVQVFATLDRTYSNSVWLLPVTAG